MTLPWSVEFAGRLDEHAFESEALKGNALDDPHVRPLWVYVPPGYDDEPENRYPSIYLIQGLTGQLDMWRNRAIASTPCGCAATPAGGSLPIPFECWLPPTNSPKRARYKSISRY